MKGYIYSENDIRKAIQDANEDTINLGEDFLEAFIKRVKYNLDKFTNLYRFYDRNCGGCVCSNKECDFAHGRGKAVFAWKKAKAGEIFDCPVRTNGTMIFSPGKGFEKIDISDRDKPPYPIVKEV